MKRIVSITVTFIFFALAFTSCEPLGSCKICREIDYKDGFGIINEGPEAEYCDAELIAKETQDDFVVNGIRYYWECR